MSKVKVKSIYKGILFLFLFGILSRGFFELFLEKKTAFIVQVAFIIVFIGLSMLIFKVRLKTKYFATQVVFSLVFLFSVIVSIIITKTLDHGGAPIFYSGIMIFLMFSFVIISSMSLRKYEPLNIGKKIIFLIIILFSVAIYEQLTNTLMPGAWWYGPIVRPASITGSKQHYSIVVAIISLFLFQYWLTLKEKKYLFGFVLGSIAVVLSLSRSGAMIIVLAFFPYILSKLYSTVMIMVNPKWVMFIMVAFGVVLIGSLIYFDFSFFIERVVSSIDTKSAGNGLRVKQWILGIDMIFSSNMLFGEYTGVVTNATRTVTKTKSFVVESGILQMILNFGLLGFIAFYAALLNVYSRIKKEHFFLLLVLFSCLISTFVYQSIETIPFIMLVSIIPLISNDIKKIEEKS